LIPRVQQLYASLRLGTPRLSLAPAASISRVFSHADSRPSRGRWRRGTRHRRADVRRQRGRYGLEALSPSPTSSATQLRHDQAAHLDLSYVVLRHTMLSRDTHPHHQHRLSQSLNLSRVERLKADGNLDDSASLAELVSALSHVIPENKAIFHRIWEMVAEIQQSEDTNQMTAQDLRYHDPPRPIATHDAPSRSTMIHRDPYKSWDNYLQPRTRACVDHMRSEHRGHTST